MHSPKLNAVIVAGSRNAGKTAYLAETVIRAKAHGYAVGGFLSIGEMHDREKHRYFLEDIVTGERRLLARRTGTAAHPQHAGPFHFDQDTFDWAKERITQSLDADLIIIDEYGPLEQDEGGHYAAISFLKENYAGILMLSVRPGLVRPLKKLLSSIP